MNQRDCVSVSSSRDSFAAAACNLSQRYLLVDDAKCGRINRHSFIFSFHFGVINKKNCTLYAMDDQEIEIHEQRHSTRYGSNEVSGGAATRHLLSKKASNAQNYQALPIHHGVHPPSDDDDVVPIQTPSNRRLGRLLLFLVAFLYGTLNVSLRLVYSLDNPPQPSALSTVRGWLAVTCFTPFLMNQKSRQQQQQQQKQQRPLWSVALELAIWNFGAQALVNVGLLWITSARAAFLTETSVVITPIISALAGHTVKWTVWVACGIAMSGLIVLSDDNEQGRLFHFGVGDILTLCGAVCWSLYVFRLSDCGKYDEVQMQALKTVLLACLYSTWFGISSLHSGDVSLWTGYTNVAAWLLLFYSALGPGTIADIVQQKGQSFVSAAEANVIIAMEPVFTSILGFIILGEAMTLQEFLGGGLLIVAAILATT